MRWEEFKRAAKEFLFGLFYFDLYWETRKEAAKLRDAVNLLIMGELLGLPLMTTPIMLRLLPYLLPEIEGWKQRQLRERDITEEVPETV